MNISLEKTSDLTANVNVHIESADYKKQVKNELKKYAKDLKIPGFRPGKVPIGMVRKMAGIGLVIDEVQKIVNEKLNQYFTEEELNILGDPIPTETKSEDDFDLYCETDMDFSFELGIAPEFELDFQFDGIPAKYEIEIDDAYLNDEIEKLQDRYAEVEQPETVEQGDIIFGKVFEVGEDGEAVEEGFEQTIPLNPERVENESLFESFIGKNVGDTLPFDLFSVGETDEDIAKLTFIEADDLEDLKDKSFHYEIKRLNRTTPAKLDENFFVKVAENFGWELEGEDDGIEEVVAEEVTTEENEGKGSEEQASETHTPSWDETSFRERLREAHAEEIKDVESQRFHGDIYKALLDEYESLEFPADFLKKWLGAINEGKKTAEEIEEEFPDFKRSLTWSLITEKLQKANEELTVTPEEVTQSIQAFIRQYGGGALTQEQEQEYMMNLLQNKEIVNQHYSRLSTGKIFPYIEEQTDPPRMAISATEFFKMIDDERKEEEEKKEKELEEAQKKAEELAKAQETEETEAEEAAADSQE